MIRSFEIFAELAKLVSYKPGWFILCKQDDKGMFLQVEVTAIAEASIDTVTGQRTGWKGAKHYFSGHMCDSEFVGTIFKAFLQAEEHESREHFRFKGRSVYNPHFNIHALVELAKHKENLDMRENAMSMVEEPPKPLTEEEIIQNIIDNSHGCRELEYPDDYWVLSWERQSAVNTAVFKELYECDHCGFLYDINGLSMHNTGVELCDACYDQAEEEENEDFD